MFFLKIDQLPVFTSYLFVIGQFVLKVISYLAANNRKLINFLSTQFFNLRKCIESIFEEHYNWNDNNNTVCNVESVYHRVQYISSCRYLELKVFVHLCQSTHVQ